MIARIAFTWLTLTAIVFAAEPAKKKILLIGQGSDGHPPATHEFVAGTRVMAACLEQFPQLQVKVVRADEPWNEGPELLAQADGVVLFVSEGARWLARDSKREEAFDALAKRGGGLVALHWAMGTKPVEPIQGFIKLFGGCHGGPDRKHQVLETRLQPADPQHPISAGIAPLTVREEFYYRLKFVDDPDRLRPVMQADVEGNQETVAWSWERPDGGRSFGFSGLHFHDNWKHEAYRRLVTQAILWTVNEPIPQSIAVDVPEAILRLP